MNKRLITILFMFTLGLVTGCSKSDEAKNPDDQKPIPPVEQAGISLIRNLGVSADMGLALQSQGVSLASLCIQHLKKLDGSEIVAFTNQACSQEVSKSITFSLTIQFKYTVLDTQIYYVYKDSTVVGILEVGSASSQLVDLCNSFLTNTVCHRQVSGTTLIGVVLD